MKEYLCSIYEEFHKTSYTPVIFIYSSGYIVEKYVKNLWSVCNRLLFKILHNFE